jgi:hydrogenase/urease accessory protein HupE
MKPRQISWPLAALAWLLAVLAAAPALAHEVRPGYLDIEEIGPNRYAVTWKMPISNEVKLALTPRLPEGCTREGTGHLSRTGASVLERWAETCPEPIDGKPIRIEGLEKTITSVFVRASFAGGESFSAIARPATPEVELGKGAPPAVPRYFMLGVEHILSGWDHLLFVAGLVVLISGFGRLVRALTAFTIAHSITLGAAALGLAGLQPRPVEAVVALSIMAVGVEIVRNGRGQGGLTTAAPWAVAFGFGLLHGFGFAGALSDIGLPQDARITALLLFNLGVEAGQLMVVLLLALPVIWMRRQPAPLALQWNTAAGYLIGTAGAFWLTQRIVGAWTAATF